MPGWRVFSTRWRRSESVVAGVAGVRSDLLMEPCLLGPCPRPCQRRGGAVVQAARLRSEPVGARLLDKAGDLGGEVSSVLGTCAQQGSHDRAVGTVVVVPPALDQ